MKQYDIATFTLPEGEALYDTLDELANQADLLSKEADRHEGDQKINRFYRTLAELGYTRIIQIMYLTNKQTKDNIILNMENIRATEETNESMLTPLERHLWNQFLNGTEGAGNGNE